MTDGYFRKPKINNTNWRDLGCAESSNLHPEPKHEASGHGKGTRGQQCTQPLPRGRVERQHRMRMYDEKVGNSAAPKHNIM